MSLTTAPLLGNAQGNAMRHVQGACKKEMEVNEMGKETEDFEEIQIESADDIDEEMEMKADARRKEGGGEDG